MAATHKAIGINPKKKLPKANNHSTRELFRKERLFGQLLLKSKKITPGKLKDALSYQKEILKRGKARKIGEILIEAGYISQDDVIAVLKKQSAIDLMRGRKFKRLSKKATSKSKTLKNLVIKYKKGEIVFREGDASGNDLYVIQSGEIGVYKNSIHLGKLFGRGAFLGTTSCLLKVPRIATAVAMTDSVLLKIEEKDVKNFFAKNPQMALKLSSVLAQRVSQLTQKYVEVISERNDYAEKLHDPLLIDSAENDSIESDDGVAGVFDEPLVNDNQLLADNRKIDITQLQLEQDKTDIHEDIVKSEVDEIALISVEEEKIGVTGDTGNSDAIAAEKEKPDTVVEELYVPAGSDSAEAKVAGGGQDVTDTGKSGEVDQCARCEPGTDPDFSGEYFVSIPEKKEPELDENGIVVAVDPYEAVLITPNSELELPEGSVQDIVAAERPLIIHAAVRELLEQRLELYIKLEEINAQRDELEAVDKTSDKAKNELSSLRREQSKTPPYEQLKMKRDKLAEMVKAQESDGADSEKPVLAPDVVAAYKLSVAQKDVLLKWYEGMDDIIAVCAKGAVGQLMYKVLARVGVYPNAVFGWAAYVMAMNEYFEELKDTQRQLKDRLKDIQDEQDTKKSGGIFNLFKKKSDVDDEEQEALELEREELEGEDNLCRIKSSAITKEIAAIESLMVDAFWAVYGALGLKLAKGVDKKCECYIRCYLRWGALGYAQDFIQPKIIVQMLTECAQGVKIEKFGMDSNYILYADEVIELTARKLLLPSPNEDLEMNARNSPEWKVDRAHRKIVGGQFYLNILADLQKILEGIVAENVTAREEKEKELEAVVEDDPDRKKKVKVLKRAAQNFKINAVKTEKLVEKVKNEMAAKIQLDIDSGKETLEELQMEAQPEDLARHEIGCIRRFSRLVAKLQEPFLPFSLRDRFDPELKTTNTREDMAAVLNDVETKDPQIFRENMLSSMKRNNRVQIRTSPFIHILPASGIMGFVVAPRLDAFSGKILLPGYFERSGMREAIAIESFSDFRYDTSKEQAGNDVMNSDTLVAAYAEVRWILRKKDKDVRQKAGIFTDENERTNWRRHYAMYMNSAFDGGKQLFFKCPDLYELVINKFIELPEGVEVLSRG